MYRCVYIFGDFHDVSVRKLWKICAWKLRDIYDQDSLKFHFTKWSNCQVEPQTANKMLSTNKLTTGQSPQHIPRKQFPFIGLSGQILISKASLLMEEKICLLTQTKVLQQCQSKLHKRTRQKATCDRQELPIHHDKHWRRLVVSEQGKKIDLAQNFN